MATKKLSLNFLSSLLGEAIPQYESMLADIEDNGGHFSFSDEANNLIKNLKIENYPTLYCDQDIFNKMALLAVMSAEEINAIGKEYEETPDDQKTEYLDQFATGITELADAFVEALPRLEEVSEEKRLELQAQLETFPIKEREAATQQYQIIISSFLAQFGNLLTMMVHGRSMIDLVKAAKSGDDESLCIAAQMDRRVLTAIPYFSERHAKALVESDSDFLDRLHYRTTNPFLRGKIKYRTLWLVFAMLDLNGYLDGSLKHRKILDLYNSCLPKNSKQYINDLNLLSKRLIQYRQFQQLNQKSMH